MQEDDWITYFGKTDARNQQMPFGIKQSDRSKHTYTIGKSGMGKSTMLENMAVQDIQNGNGLTFIDPHGSTAEKLLDYIPEHRVKDVLYFAPHDLGYPISFNVLENVDPDKRFLVVNGLMSAFEKIWEDAWSARMAYILQNTLYALLEYPDATILDVNYMYTHKNFRKEVLRSVTDPTVKSFWEKEFANYGDRYVQEATPAIQNKIGQFASSSLVRNIIGQPESAFDIRDLMDERKIFIVNLSKGLVGEGNANLLGSMLITKLYLAAMSRADASPAVMRKLPPHYLYVDEFQSFANKSFADILSEARKYKLALTIAHQYIEQMEEEVRAAVFGNVGTMISFRVGAYDAEVLEKEFAPTFTIEDIVNLGARQIYLKLMIDNCTSQPFSATTLPPIDEPEISYRDMAIANSRRIFAQPRSEVEETIAQNIAERDDAEDAGGGKRGPGKNGRQPDRAPREKMLALVMEREQKPARPEGGGEDARAERSEKPKTKEEKNKEDLRGMLGAIVEEQEKKEQEEEKKKTESRKEKKPVSKGGGDDGKGVTEEDKSQLKEALATLLPRKDTKPKDAPSKKHEQDTNAQDEGNDDGDDRPKKRKRKRNRKSANREAGRKNKEQTNTESAPPDVSESAPEPESPKLEQQQPKQNPPEQIPHQEMPIGNSKELPEKMLRRLLDVSDEIPKPRL